ncbi:transglycosylase SLT domain-containing protein [Paragemmobacter straminiformis]|uniref:Transglycosylase SLT domain-containing protein n=1 Tax=Paragemmobacter straminiformis TaxID=2045119 RepID=A0A842I8L3_9RHOB|nr:transglycosylase SLT domain-containing protein [Gemmobacter straminiformis]MBC2835414.1 transglycosylase SLT domain-containing protein [Gemmobacter straminiformis]
MPQITRRSALALSFAALLAACGSARPEPQGPAEINRLIAKYARKYDVPERLVHHVVKIESGYNPAARNGPYYGLMQIVPQTAQTMGHRGPASDLLDADTNLKYGVKYLRGAYLVARGNEKRAYDWYRRGYYYEAKRMGLLEETGLRS